MKSMLFSIFILTITVATGYGQVKINWQKNYGGSAYDKGYSVCTTSDGGCVMAGGSESNDAGYTGNHGISDFLIIKTNGIGDVQWKKFLGGTGHEEAKSISTTTDGGYIIAGFSNSTNGNVIGCHSSIDYWVVKLNYNGNILFSRCFGGFLRDEPYSVIQTTDGGYIVAGFAESNNGNVTGNHGLWDCWIIKLDLTGNLIDQVCIGGSLNDVATSVIQTTDGGYIIVGYSNSSDGDILLNKGGTDLLITKLDSALNIQWVKTYGGTLNDGAQSVIQTYDGNFCVAGYTNSNDFDVSGSHGNSDSWIICVDSNGALLWQRCIGDSGSNDASSIIESPDHNLVFVGNTGYYRLDRTGNVISHASFSMNYGATLFDVDLTPEGGFIATGYVPVSYVLMPPDWDFFTVKLIEPNIKGNIFNDGNENGIKDIGEQGVFGHLVCLNSGMKITYTNDNGDFYFLTDTGLQAVKYIPQQYWYETTNNYYYYVALDSLNQLVDTLDFAVKSRVNVNDVSVYITGSPTRANFGTHYWLSYKNWGTVTENGTIEFQYDPLLTYNASTPLIPVSHLGNTLTFAYDTLGPGVQRMLRVDFQVPGVQNLEDTLHSFAMITPLVLDTFVTNNYDTLQQVITGSYDPNDKTVSPAGYEQWGFVEHDQRLTYTIRFQNTGTDTAFTVVIRDTLDADLDIETFVVEAYSHPVTCHLHSGYELFFTFQNILLPDSNVNEPESHGFIRYSISPKLGLADGTTATNTSYIFFDYNPAVVTNTTLNTFVTNIPVAKPILEMMKTLVFPNPSSDYVYINLPEFTSKVDVYNSSGSLVQQLVPQKQVAEINAKDLAKGVYVVKIFSGKGVITTRFLKE